MSIPSQPVLFALFIIALTVGIPVIVFAIAWLLMRWAIVSQTSTLIRRVTFGALAVGYTLLAVLEYTDAGIDHRTVFFIVAAFGWVIVALHPAHGTRSSQGTSPAVPATRGRRAVQKCHDDGDLGG